MPGPEPASQRRRRNAPIKELERVYLPPEGRSDRVPAVPTTKRLLKSSREQWKAWWKSPMAVMWDRRFDVFPLCRLLELHDRFRREGVKAAELTEMRQLEGRFGLDPRSRKELGWVIAEPFDDDDGKAGDEGPATPQAAKRRYGHLQVVDDAADQG